MAGGAEGLAAGVVIEFDQKHHEADPSDAAKHHREQDMPGDEIGQQQSRRLYSFPPRGLPTEDWAAFSGAFNHWCCST